MGLSNAYVQGYGKLPELFQKIRDGQAPDQLTHQLLKDWGLSSSNDRQEWRGIKVHFVENQQTESRSGYG